MAKTTGNGNRHLTNGRLLARNTIWNLVGNAAPLVVALFSIPILIRSLGKDRFGILTLAWALIGYASLFDIGLGRALTQVVSKKLGTSEENDVPKIVWTSLLLMFALGVLGTALVASISPWLVHRALKIPALLQAETIRAFYLLALSIPAVIVAAGLRGLLEAHQRFDLVTYLRLPMGAFTFAGPLVVLPYSRSLVPVVAILVAARFVSCVAHFIVCLQVAPELHRSMSWHMASAGPLLRVGGWMTVSNIVSPVMVYMDRVLIGMALSVGAVALYAVPSEIVGRVSIIPGAMAAVLFPAFTNSLSREPARIPQILSRGLKYAFLSVFPIILVMVTFAPEGLSLWLGRSFSMSVTVVFRWLAVGGLINCLAFVPFALIQSLGRPDITAKLHLLELPLYLAAFRILVEHRGIEGAAIAAALRVCFDAALLFVFVQRLLPQSRGFWLRFLAAVATALFLLLVGSVLVSVTVKCVLVLVTLALAASSWPIFLAPDEKAYVLRMRTKFLVRESVTNTN